MRGLPPDLGTICERCDFGILAHLLRASWEAALLFGMNDLSVKRSHDLRQGHRGRNFALRRMEGKWSRPLGRSEARARGIAVLTQNTRHRGDQSTSLNFRIRLPAADKLGSLRFGLEKLWL